MTRENLTTRLRERLFANPYLLLALTALNHVLGRAIAGHVPPFGISMARWLVGAIVLWPGNMMVWAIYCCLLRFKPRMHWLSFIWVFSAISGLAMVPAHVWEHRSGFPFHADWETALSIAYVAIFPSILAFLFWNRGVELIGANRASAFLHLTPIYSAILASVMLGEHLQAYHVIGFALILSGVRFASKKA